MLPLRTVRLAILCFVALSLLPSQSARAQATDVFNNTCWTVTVEPDSAALGDGANAFDDGVLFLGNQFSAAAVAMLGFSPAAYTVDGNNFSVSLTSRDHGTMVWAGVKGANGLRGSVVWTKPDGKVHRYTIAGTAAAPEDAGG